VANGGLASVRAVGRQRFLEPASRLLSLPRRRRARVAEDGRQDRRFNIGVSGNESAQLLLTAFRMRATSRRSSHSFHLAGNTTHGPSDKGDSIWPSLVDEVAGPAPCGTVMPHNWRLRHRMKAIGITDRPPAPAGENGDAVSRRTADGRAHIIDRASPAFGRRLTTRTFPGKDTRVQRGPTLRLGALRRSPGSSTGCGARS